MAQAQGNVHSRIMCESQTGGLQAAPSPGVPSTGTGAELPRRREALPARSEGHQQGHGFLPALS